MEIKINENHVSEGVDEGTKIPVTVEVPPFAGDVKRESEKVEVRDGAVESDYEKWQSDGYMRNMLIEEIPLVKGEEGLELDREKFIKKLSPKELKLYNSVGEHKGDVVGATIKTGMISGRDGDYVFEEKLKKILDGHPELEKELKIVALVTDVEGSREGLKLQWDRDKTSEEGEVISVPVMAVARVPSFKAEAKPIDVV
jgi:hypothetical protein